MSQNTRQRATQAAKSAAQDLQRGNTEQAKDTLKTEGQNLWQQVLAYTQIIYAFIATWTVYLWTMMKPYLSQAAVKGREVAAQGVQKGREYAPVIMEKSREIAAMGMEKAQPYISQGKEVAAQYTGPIVDKANELAATGMAQAHIVSDAAKGYAAAGMASVQNAADAAVAQLPPSTVEAAKNLAAQASAGASVAVEKAREVGSQIYNKSAEVAAPAMDAARGYAVAGMAQAQAAVSNFQSKASEQVDKVAESAQQAVDTVNQAASDVASASASAELKKQPSVMTQIKAHVVVPQEEADREYQRQLIETALAVAQSQ